MKTAQEIFDKHYSIWTCSDHQIKAHMVNAMEEYASEQNAELKAENERLKSLLKDGMEEAFIAGKNADEWDQMCGWIQHYCYADWIAKWRKTNALPIQREHP
jgi:hypothetical protein